jgi:hypothetical protein
MTQTLSLSRRLIRAIHAGIAGVLFVLLPIAIGGDENLRDAMARWEWNAFRVPVYWVLLGLIFLAVALYVRRANLAVLCLFVLLDLPMIKFFWDTVKGALLAPVLVISVLCLLIEISKLVIVRRRQTA